MKKLLVLLLLIPVIVVQNANAQDWLWARSAGNNCASGNAVVTDASGNVYVTGSYSCSTITFGTTVLNNVFTSGSDLFIVKYDSLGNIIWAKSAGGHGNDVSQAITTDASGNVYITGLFYSRILILIQQCL